jgi:hypothetical protein
VTDIEAWSYNLTEANLKESENPFWFRQFSFREAFHLPDLLPLTMNDFVESLLKNSSAIQQVRRFLPLTQRTALSSTFIYLALEDENSKQRFAAEKGLR